jgi:hypothetical protein
LRGKIFWQGCWRVNPAFKNEKSVAFHDTELFDAKAQGGGIEP